MMDGSYHQFVNNKKQNHFINAETHRPDFVHSETKKRNEKTKKPSKKKTTDERLKALQKDIERQRALNKLPRIYQKNKNSKKSKNSEKNKNSKKYSDKKPSGKGGLGWKHEAIRNTRHLERSDSDESVTSDSESDLSSDSESDFTENLGEMTQKQMTEKL